MNQSLKQQLLDIFDVYIDEKSSTKAIVKELNRRGKITLVKLTEIIFLLVEHLDAEVKKK